MKYLEVIDEAIHRVKNPMANTGTGIEIVDKILKVSANHTFHVVKDGRSITLVEKFSQGNAYILKIVLGPRSPYGTVLLDVLFCKDAASEGILEKFKVIDSRLHREESRTSLLPNNIDINYLGKYLPTKIDGKRFIISEYFIYTLTNMAR